jgi:hypothetical protein
MYPRYRYPVTETIDEQADSMREILARAMEPEIQARIREAVRDSYEAQDLVWRELIRGADVVLDGESMIVLDGGSIPYEKDLSVLREEAIQLITKAGRISVIVDFAQEIATSRANAHVIDQAVSRLRKAVGASGASPGLLLAIVLILLIAGALPLVQTALPVRDQALITNEEASLGLALAVVSLIMSKKQ